MHPEVDVSKIREFFRKGEYTAAYSGFEGHAVADESTLMADWLRENGVAEVEVVGIATDHCVLATAQDALREGFEVSVIEMLCSPVDKTRGERMSLTQLEEAGAEDHTIVGDNFNIGIENRSSGHVRRRRFYEQNSDEGPQSPSAAKLLKSSPG